MKLPPTLVVGMLVVGAFLSLHQDALLTAQHCLASSLHESVTDKNSDSSLSKPPPVIIEDDYDGPVTVYKQWKGPFPCVPADEKWRTVKVQRSPTKEGLLFLREMKVGSSTLAGVILRIAKLKGQELLSPKTECNMRIDHSSARHMQYAQRNPQKSFLVSLLRDPTKRAISQFFHFRVSTAGVVPTDKNFQRSVTGGKFGAPSKLAFGAMSNYYMKDLTFRPDMEKELRMKNRTHYDDLVQELLDQYDFIGITERMDESLVVLKMLLHLDLDHILYMSAKSAGFTSTGNPQEPCTYLVPSFLTPGMQEFFSSNFWRDYVAADNALYKAAWASLDRTIDRLGRDVFQQELADFRRMLQEAHAQCASSTVYKCNAQGDFVGDKNSTCVMWDIGCGNECLDDFSKRRRGNQINKID